ncbi:MAG TPA: acetylglutamate kinase [Planctomycetota bacterium]|nr:acetylglutamate kinase [Planctomycetota bacterium]
MKAEHVDLLRQALPYINRFKNKVFVIKIGGDIADEEPTLLPFCEEVALLVQVGIRVVVVHGGGKQATELSEKLGIEPRIINGRRVTDDRTLDVVKMTFAGLINTEILGALRRYGIAAVGLSGVDGNIVHATRRPPKRLLNEETGKSEMVDFGHVGDIDRVDDRLLKVLLDADYVPVVASLGADAEGHVFNINADTVAGFIARSLGAEKLILASDVDGIYKGDGGTREIIQRATIEEVRGLIRTGVIRGGMVPKAESAIEALGKGVSSVHIINGMRPTALLTEIFTDSGCGTMIFR